MSTYLVTVARIRRVHETLVIEVEAESAAEARVNALAAQDFSSPDEWEADDGTPDVRSLTTIAVTLVP